MDKIINFKINGTSVEAKNGESILQVARREGMYIPTMCYLAKTTPNASCRMCVVEVKDVDGFVLSCNTPPVEGAEISTDSEALFKERQNIMKLYNVNHPLQCGVCDKSGECDLQNNTLEFELDEQSFANKDQGRKKKKWGVLSYDPGLCIMCEKCTSVCNQIVGSEALYIKPGGYSSVIDNHSQPSQLKLVVLMNPSMAVLGPNTDCTFCMLAKPALAAILSLPSLPQLARSFM